MRYMPVTSITHCAGTYHIPCAHSYRLPHSHITALGHIDTAHENKYRSYGHVVAYPQPFPCTTCCIVRQFCFAFDEIPLKNAKKKTTNIPMYPVHLLPGHYPFDGKALFISLKSTRFHSWSCHQNEQLAKNEKRAWEAFFFLYSASLAVCLQKYKYLNKL